MADNEALIDELAGLALFADLPRPQLARGRPHARGGMAPRRPAHPPRGLHAARASTSSSRARSRSASTARSARGSIAAPSSARVASCSASRPAPTSWPAGRVRVVNLGGPGLPRFLMRHPSVMYRMLQEQTAPRCGTPTDGAASGAALPARRLPARRRRQRPGRPAGQLLRCGASASSTPSSRPTTGPGGMFLRFPFFQRLLSWTKPYAPVPRGDARLRVLRLEQPLGEEPDASGDPCRADGRRRPSSLAAGDGGLAGRSSCARAGLPIRYGCRWQATRARGRAASCSRRRDGEYRCPAVVFAVGVAEAFTPDSRASSTSRTTSTPAPPSPTPASACSSSASRTRASSWPAGCSRGPAASCSPRRGRPSSRSRRNSLAGIRARYVQPVEDRFMGGGVFILDAAIDGVERVGDAPPGAHSRLGRQRRAWTSRPTRSSPRPASRRRCATCRRSAWRPSVRAGCRPRRRTGRAPRCPASTSRAPSPWARPGSRRTASAAPAPSRARATTRAILARTLAERHFGVELPREPVAPSAVVDRLLEEASDAPELWNQKGYLARAILVGPDGPFDDGIVPLQAFVDGDGPDGAAITLEGDADGVIRPVAYVRRRGADQRGHARPRAAPRVPGLDRRAPPPVRGAPGRAALTEPAPRHGPAVWLRARTRSASSTSSSSRAGAARGWWRGASEVARDKVARFAGPRVLGAAGARLRRHRRPHPARRPGAGRPRQQPHGADVHRRRFRQLPVRGAARRRPGHRSRTLGARRRHGPDRRPHHGRRALRAAGQQAHDRPSATAACPTWPASWRCSSDVRVIVGLGSFGWDGALRALAANGLEIPRPRPQLRARRRSSHRAATCCSAPSTPASRTRSPASSRRRCWRPSFGGPSSSLATEPPSSAAERASSALRSWHR